MKASLTVLILTLATGSAWSQTIHPPLPVCGAGGVTTLAEYISVYGSTGCTIEDKIFYGFGYLGGDGVTDPSDVMVTPIATPLDPGLDFNALWAVGVNHSGDAGIFYDVSVKAGGALIEDDSLGLQGVSNLTGDAFIKVVESVCLGSALDSSHNCPAGFQEQNPVLQVNAPNNQNNFFDDLTFGGNLYSTLGIFKDIGLNGGTTAGGGTGASLSNITQQFSEQPVPEPTSVLLLGTCLLLIAPVLKRRLG